MPIWPRLTNHFTGKAAGMLTNGSPSDERIPTIAEIEELFAGLDAITGTFNGTPTTMIPFRPTPSIHYYGNELAFSMTEGLDCFFYWMLEWKGIYVTNIVPPAQGWPVAMYCPLCKETTFLLSPWAIEPTEGGYLTINDTCANEDVYIKHNIKMAFDPLKSKSGQA